MINPPRQLTDSTRADNLAAVPHFHDRRLLDELLNAHGIEPGAFNSEIGAADRPLRDATPHGHGGHAGRALRKYVESGLRLEAMLARVVARVLGGYHSIDRILVWCAGDARLARTLVHRVAPSQVWVADPDPHACAWQASQLGVNALFAVTDPDRFALPLDFSLVYAGSVPAGGTDAGYSRWIARLYRCVGEQGVLVLDAGAHGARREPLVRQCVADLFPWRPPDALRVPRGLAGEPDLLVVAGWGTSLRGLRAGVTSLDDFDALRVEARAG